MTPPKGCAPQVFPGYGSAMTSRGFKVAETIDLPAEALWNVLTDWARAPEWMGPVEYIAVADGGTTRANATLRFGSRGAERESTITTFDPPRQLALTSTQSGVTAVYQYHLREVGERTEITLEATCTASGLIRLLHPLIGYLMKRADSGQLAALKRTATRPGLSAS